MRFHVNEGCNTDAMDFAAINGNLEIVKWLHGYIRIELKIAPRMRWIDYAARNGYIEIGNWLNGNRIEGYTEKAMDAGAENGHREIDLLVTCE
jgi:hypothetical protein